MCIRDSNIDVLHKLGFKTCAMALTDDSVSIDDPVLHSEERLAILLGTEGDGLHEQTIDLSLIHISDTDWLSHRLRLKKLTDNDSYKRLSESKRT